MCSGLLVRLLPRGSAQVRPIEVVIAGCVLGAVLLEGRLVSGQASLAQRERLLPFLHAAEAALGGSLEGLVGLEAGLEVHPVLRGVAEGLLLELGLVAVVATDRHILVVGWSQKKRGNGVSQRSCDEGE